MAYALDRRNPDHVPCQPLPLAGTSPAACRRRRTPRHGAEVARQGRRSCAGRHAAANLNNGVNMYLDEVKQIVIDVLALGPAGRSLDEHSALLGSIPELDSMAV